MSNYATPFLVLNLGAEMVFVIAQRLEAQNVTSQRAALVLDEIVSTLISKHLIADIVKPQLVYSHDAVRDIIEDVTQSSVMRLDKASMNKLWDLITMVFKWQVLLSEDIIKITQRHLYEIETYVTNAETQLQLHKVQNLIDNFDKILDETEKNTLLEDTKYWLRNYNVRVSLLLRMGLQTMEGTFLIDNLNPFAEEMLKNLGENIYQVTQNGRILEKQAVISNNNFHEENNKNTEMTNELQMFLDQMLGDRKEHTNSSDGHVLRLAISDDLNMNKNDQTSPVTFDNIDVSVDNERKMKLLDDDLCSSVDTENKCEFRSDLLEYINDKETD